MARPPESASGLSVGELGEILKLPQSTVSRHLKTLSDAGLADARREGTSTFYRLPDAASGDLAQEVHQLRQMARDHLKHDPTAGADARRLQEILRKRELARHGSNGLDAFFGKNAPQWEQLRAQWFGDRFHLEGLLALLSPRWHVVDVGAGTGVMLPLLAPHVGRVIAVDASAAMLKGARKRVEEMGWSNVEIRHGSAEHLPLEDASMDVAVLTLVMIYTHRPQAALEEVHRVLKPGGTVLVMDMQAHSVDLFREKLNHRWMGFSREQLTEWLTAAGFHGLRWIPLAARLGRSKEAAALIPDLFAMRGETAHE